MDHSRVHSIVRSWLHRSFWISRQKVTPALWATLDKFIFCIVSQLSALFSRKFSSFTSAAEQCGTERKDHKNNRKTRRKNWEANTNLILKQRMAVLKKKVSSYTNLIFMTYLNTSETSIILQGSPPNLVTSSCILTTASKFVFLSN